MDDPIPEEPFGGAPAGDDTLVDRLIVSGVVAAIVAAVALWRDVGGVWTVVAVVAAVAAFWAIDSVLTPRTSERPTFAPGVDAPLDQVVEVPTERLPATPGDEAAGAPRQGARLDPAQFDPASVEVKAVTKGSSRIFSIRIAKHGSRLEECEDAVSVDPRRAVLAVSDGASSSFGAGEWATALTRAYVASPPRPLSVGSFSEWLETARGAVPEPDDATVPRGDTGWWADRADRSGAYATIVGAAMMTDGGTRVATIMCVGDSCAFVLTGERGTRSMRRAIPYEDATQFGSHPALLGSRPAKVDDDPSWTTVATTPGDVIVLATDAVGEWLLADPQRFAVVDELEPDELVQLLVEERAAGRIVNDDLTVAVLELGAGG